MIRNNANSQANSYAHTSPAVFRLIALSSVLCNTIEYMIQIRLKRFLLKKTTTLFPTIYSASDEVCFSSLIGPVYKAFCKKEYLFSAFVDI